MRCFRYVKCMSGCDLTKIEISATAKLKVMYFGQNTYETPYGCSSIAS